MSLRGVSSGEGLGESYGRHGIHEQQLALLRLSEIQNGQFIVIEMGDAIHLHHKRMRRHDWMLSLIVVFHFENERRLVEKRAKVHWWSLRFSCYLYEHFHIDTRRCWLLKRINFRFRSGFVQALESMLLLQELRIRSHTCLRNIGRFQAKKKVHKLDYDLRSSHIRVSRSWWTCAKAKPRVVLH